MVRGNKRSRTFRRVYVKTPGGNTVLHYRKRKSAKPQCGACGKVLPGVARGRITDIKKLSKTERRPERPFGGSLCSPCMRIHLKAQARAHV